MRHCIFNNYDHYFAKTVPDETFIEIITYNYLRLHSSHEDEHEAEVKARRLNFRIVK